MEQKLDQGSVFKHSCNNMLLLRACRSYRRVGNASSNACENEPQKPAARPKNRQAWAENVQWPRGAGHRRRQLIPKLAGLGRARPNKPGKMARKPAVALQSRQALAKRAQQPRDTGRKNWQPNSQNRQAWAKKCPTTKENWP